MNPLISEWKKLKEDNRPAKFGWAPGGYINQCLICRNLFIGDKRACHCADCAYKDNNIKNEK